MATVTISDSSKVALLKLKKFLCVVICNVFYHLINAFHFAYGYFTVFYIIA